MSEEISLFNIGVVERETGIGKDTLRVWEKRYGFPLPVRDQHEDRLYPAEQVDQLRLIKRLLDIGMRPAKVVGLSYPELNALLTETPGEEPVYSSELLEFVELIKAHQGGELKLALNLALLRQGMGDFLSKTIHPLNLLVGDAWLRGEIRVFEEHLYSEQIISVLRTAITTIRNPRGTPRVLLTTLPGEEHSLGLLMAEATLSLSRAYCTMLGVQTPISEIVLAVQAHQADVLTLSFSSAMPAAQVKSGVEQVRKALPGNVSLWIGGAGVQKQRNVEPGIQVMGPLSDLTGAVLAWRAAISGNG
ncbi:HTH-type transcriptional regulator MlrA [mine drainage metagenome]|uniref:HTH-type transcriptional regulator MlrA n=1 Tax=mine drainage metagenome TaxID=410659 RepID=A0A1J5SL51_9ZZZZ